MLVALGLIIVGAVFFVDAVEHLATSLGVSEVLLALVIAPVATELPEKFNSIIWVRQNKDTLAMGNITGAMVFQSTIPTVVGLVLASDAWSIRGGLVHGLRLGRDRVHRVGGDLHPDGPRAAGCAAGTCWSAACSTSPTSILVIVVVRATPARNGALRARAVSPGRGRRERGHVRERGVRVAPATGGVAPAPRRAADRSRRTTGPSRLAGTWSWYRLWATCRIRSRGRPEPLERDLEVALGRLVCPDLLGRDDPVELDAQPLGSRPRTGRRRSW